jgi:hypothetical protein
MYRGSEREPSDMPRDSRIGHRVLLNMSGATVHCTLNGVGRQNIYGDRL